MRRLAPEPGRIAPGPRGHPIFGILFALRRDPLRTFLDAVNEFGDVVRVRIGPVLGHIVRDPEGVHRVLAENNKNYDKQTPGYEKLRLILGQGLLTAEGETWRRQRRIVQPAFHRQRIANFAQAMVEEAERTADRWTAPARSVEPFDVAAEMTRLTLAIIARTMLSHDATDDAVRVGSALTSLLRMANAQLLRPLPRWIPTLDALRFPRALRVLDIIVFRILEERRRAGEEKPDLVSLLMSAREEDTGQPMTDAQLRDELMTFLLAGHETTANLLTWTFYLLARSPPAGRELLHELEIELGGRNPTFDDLPRLRFTRMVLDESLRLYPPAWLLARSAVEDDEIGGYRIPAGTLVFVCPYLVHRHPRIWESPEGFDPERFAPERAARIPRGAYFPFGEGPRQCIGNTFALIEAQLVLATLWQRFRLDLVSGFSVEPEPSITLRPRHGIRVTAHARS